MQISGASTQSTPITTTCSLIGPESPMCLGDLCVEFVKSESSGPFQRFQIPGVAGQAARGYDPGPISLFCALWPSGDIDQDSYEALGYAIGKYSIAFSRWPLAFLQGSCVPGCTVIVPIWT